jgi:hypothetical protein
MSLKGEDYQESEFSVRNSCMFMLINKTANLIRSFFSSCRAVRNLEATETIPLNQSEENDRLMNHTWSVSESALSPSFRKEMAALDDILNSIPDLTDCHVGNSSSSVSHSSYRIIGVKNNNLQLNEDAYCNDVRKASLTMDTDVNYIDELSDMMDESEDYSIVSSENWVDRLDCPVASSNCFFNVEI